MKIRFAEKMYNTREVDALEGYYRWRLRNTFSRPDLYVLLKNENTGAPEMVHCSYLKQDYFRRHVPTVMGIAKKKEEALALLIAMVCVEKGADFNGI